MANKTTYIQTTGKEAARLDIVNGSEQISTPCKKFLMTMVETSAANDQLITRKAFVEALRSSGLPTSAGAINRHLETLKAKGVITEEKDRILFGKRCNVLTVKDLHLLGAPSDRKKPASRRTQSHIARQLNLFDQHGTQITSHLDQLPVTQSIMCILDAAMRSSKTDTSGRDGTVLSQYRLNSKESVTIKATTSSDHGAEIAILSDLRVIRALNAMLLDQLRAKLKEEGVQKASLSSLSLALPVAKKMAAQLYYVDIDDICRRIGLKPYQANKQHVREIIRRIKDTKFEVDATESPSYRKRYFPDGDVTVGEYRFITEFYAAKEESTEQETGLVTFNEKFYWMKFHEQIVANLLVDWLAFIGHPELFTDDSGLAQRLSNWLKAWVGVSKHSAKADAEFHYLVSELHDLVLPHVRADNFYRDFISIMKRQVNRGEGVADKGCSAEWREEEGDKVLTWFYGYYIMLDFSRDTVVAHCVKRNLRAPRSKRPVPLVTISRDKTDVFVGDESTYNLILDEEREATAKKIKEERASDTVMTLDVEAWSSRADCELLCREVVDARTVRLKDEDIAFAVDGFVAHHLSKGTDELSEERWQKLWQGWCRNRQWTPSVSKQSTRLKTTIDDLTDTSWAD